MLPRLARGKPACLSRIMEPLAELRSLISAHCGSHLTPLPGLRLVASAAPTPPETTLTKGAPKRTRKSKARFRFVSDEAGSTFECKQDRKPWTPCTSPTKVTGLDEGKHRFRVRAIDAAGNVDPTPAKSKYRVVGD